MKERKKGERERVFVPNFVRSLLLLLVAASDGQLVFLHPLDMKILLNQYGSYDVSATKHEVIFLCFF